MGKNIKYTIAIPAFKGRFLKCCIDSVLRQRFTNFELIIVNDASPDPIDEILSCYNDERIRYYKNEQNSGAEYMVDNWNKCLDLAVGEYFVLLGDDDFIDVDYLDSFEELIADFPSLEVYHCRSKIVDTEGRLLDLTPPWPSFETIYDNMYYRLSMSRIHYISDFVYLTRGLRSRGGFFYLPLAWGADDITAFLACADKGLAHTNKPVLNYRESPITVTRTGSSRLKMEAVLQQERWLRNFLKKTPTDPIDQNRHSKLVYSLEHFMLMKKADLIKADLEDNGFKALIRWLKLASRYSIPKWIICRLYISSSRLNKTATR